MLPSIFDYAPEAASLVKVASVPTQDPPLDTGEAAADTNDRQLPPHPALHALKTIGAGAAGTGVGMLAGYGAGELAGRLTNNKIPTGPLLKAAPVLGGAAGLAYSLYKQHEAEELARALQAHRSSPSNTGA